MLDLQLKQMLAQMAADGAPDLADLPPEICRQVYRQILAAGDLPAADVKVANRTLEGPASKIPVRIYTPHSAADKPRGIVLYCHGGGFALGDLDAYDSVCRSICLSSDCVLLSVDYRLAPEHPFPAAIEDCFSALNWVADNAVELGADPKKLAVCGDSAGGNLAAVLTLLARKNGPSICYQLLVYPVTSAAPGELPSHDEYGEGYVLSKKAMHYFNRYYFGESALAPDFRGAPLLADDLSGLPPALIMTGAYDVLRDDGRQYADRLIEAGVPTTLIEYRGLSHGFLNMASMLPGAHLALDQVGSALRLALN